MSQRVNWAEVATNLASRIGPDRLDPAVIAWARGPGAGERWAVAVSGGADSVALLLLLWGQWPRRRRRLRAFHFNHRLRGAESTRDARFCRGLCAALGIPLSSASWESMSGAVSESAARSARFAYFDKELSKRKITALWLGHQRDDIAESLLMRIARGSGSSGLAAPRPVHRFESGRIHLRPLLTLEKAEIASLLRDCGGRWREDSTNGQGLYFRNRLRREVIPRWIKASGRDARAGAALSRQLIEEDDAALQAWADSLKPFRGSSLILARLEGCPKAVCRRVLHRWLLRLPQAAHLSRPAFETLLQSIETAEPSRQSLGTHGFAVIKKGLLRFEAARVRRGS